MDQLAGQRGVRRRIGLPGRLQPHRQFLDHRQLLLQQHAELPLCGPGQLQRERQHHHLGHPGTGRHPQQPAHRGRRRGSVLGIGGRGGTADLLHVTHHQHDDPGAGRRRGLQLQHAGLRERHPGQRRPVPLRRLPDRARPGRDLGLTDLGRHARPRATAERHRSDHYLHRVQLLGQPGARRLRQRRPLRHRQRINRHRDLHRHRDPV